MKSHFSWWKHDLGRERAQCGLARYTDKNRGGELSQLHMLIK